MIEYIKLEPQREPDK